MKKTLLWFAALLFLASLSVPTQLRADDPPNCDEIACPKPVAPAVALPRN
ncbi:MAG: hypothetical protein WAL32_17100 [Terriglobales bacterium]